ncbi:MAG: SGNH/GDSL hydrolase family protein [Bacilli bacterium]|nr:SGNH/GDSL hydrolase family protein [Bacilli bacterium]
MNKKLKLGILILLSLSVYFIYQKTNHKKENILILGDNFSLGRNSYGIYDYSYIDYYKDSIEGKEVKLNKKYCQKDLTIQSLLEKIQTYPEIKRDLKEANLLFLNVGYTDLLYKLSLKEKITPNLLNQILQEIENEFQELQKEISKYYKKKIIIIGYYSSKQKDYYQNQGIRGMNKIFQEDSRNIYIDTESILNKKEYFSNPSSYYPNRLGYQKVAEEIMRKTLEKSKNI